MDLVRSKLLCVVIPCFDEADAVDHTYAELKRVLSALPGYRHQLYFVDDGSRDQTLTRLNLLAKRDDAVRVLSLSRNFGHQAAITCGLDHTDRRADATLVMDADLENPPALIPRMLAELAAGHDVVMGVRQQGRQVGVLRRLGSRAFYWLFNKLSDVPITPGAPDFFLLSPRAREALSRMREQRRFMRAMVTWLGYPIQHVPFVPPARLHGRSKYTLTRMLGLCEDALFGFSSAPPRILLRAGIVATVLGVVALTYAAGLGLAGHAAWLPCLAGLLLALSGFHVAALGVVAGYVVRSVEESRGRPLYLLKQELDDRGVEPRLVDASPRSSEPRKRAL